MKYGHIDPTHLKILEQRRAKGLKVSILDDRPMLLDWLFDYWRAFWYINRSRSYVGMSGTPLPLSLADIKVYIDLFGIPNKEDYIDMIFAMDSVYLEVHHDKLQKAEEPDTQRKPKKK